MRLGLLWVMLVTQATYTANLAVRLLPWPHKTRTYMAL